MMPLLTPKFVNINGKYIKIKSDGLPDLKALDESDKGFIYVTEMNGEKSVFILKINRKSRILRWARMLKKSKKNNNIRLLRERSLKSLIPPKIETEESSVQELEKFRKELLIDLNEKESIPLVNLNFE